MKLTYKDPNYACEVVEVKELIELKGMDRCVGVYASGCMAIVSKGSVEVGDIGLLFPSECKLSKDFLAQNNLYRHESLNVDTTKKGYFDDDGRVKALKVRGNVSTAFFCPVDHLQWYGITPSTLKAGDSFDAVDGIVVCEKYVRPSSGRATGRNQVSKKQLSRVIDSQFQEHKQTLRFGKVYRPNIGVQKIVTQKLHGTSARFGNVLVSRKLSLVERIAKFFGAKVQDREYAGLIGTRRTVEVYNPKKKYNDIWGQHFLSVFHMIPKNWVLYGEIIGWSPEGKAVQKSYTYNCGVGKSDFYVYRIVVVNEDGFSFDLSWRSIVEWCDKNGVKCVPEVSVTPLDIEPMVMACMDKKLKPIYPQCIEVSDKDKPDEGLVIRTGELNPVFIKAKSPIFEAHESGMRDKGEEDIEEDVVMGREVANA